MPNKVDYVSANKASRAAADWAAKKREQLERAAVMRLERARAAEEGERRAAVEVDATSDLHMDQGQLAWWEDAARAQDAKGQSPDLRPTSREASRGLNRLSADPRDQHMGKGQQKSLSRHRRQWDKAPERNEWRLAEEAAGATQPGEVLWRRPAQEWQDDCQPPTKEQHPNLDFNAQISREKVSEAEAEPLDEATAAWLAMLRPDEPPPVPKTKAKHRKLPRNPPGGHAQKDALQQDEQDEVTKEWIGMLRTDNVPRAGKVKPVGAAQMGGHYCADPYANEDSDNDEILNLHRNVEQQLSVDRHLRSPPNPCQPQAIPRTRQRSRHAAERAGSWNGEEHVDESHLSQNSAVMRRCHSETRSRPTSGRQTPSATEIVDNGSHLPLVGGGQRHWDKRHAQVGAGIQNRSRKEGSKKILPDADGSVPPWRQKWGGLRQKGIEVEVFAAESQHDEPQRCEGLPPRPRRAPSKGDGQISEVTTANNNQTEHRQRRPSDSAIGAVPQPLISSRLCSKAPSSSPFTPDLSIQELGQHGVGDFWGGSNHISDHRRGSPAPTSRTPSPDQEGEPLHLPASRLPRRSARSQTRPISPARPEWDYSAISYDRPSSLPDEGPWYDGVKVRQHKESKSSVAHCGRKPIRAPLNPEIAGNSWCSTKPGRKSLRDKLAPLRKPPGGGIRKVIGTRKDDDPVTRQMVDKRQSRKDNSPSFTAAIKSYSSGVIPMRLCKGMAMKASQGLLPKSDGLGVPVYVRKRPLFAHEVRKQEYDVIAVDCEKMVVVHNCQMHPDLKRMHIMHKAFPCAYAFNDSCSNEDVYGVAASDLIESVVFGGQGAIFMYGQTGSGKTHTMSAIETLGLHQLFEGVQSHTRAADVKIAIFEIAGNKCFDLLQSGHKQIVLKETDGGAVELMGAKEPSVRSAEEALQLVMEAKSRRATASTAANATSSRSHCVTRITICSNGQGQLTLVDCAGSERNNDSMYHDAQARKESAEINASLYALRECIRLRRRQAEEAQQPHGGKHVHVPYRSSQLTRVLMECFTSADAAIAVIATVSPSSTDTEHSITTLQTVLMMSGANKDAFAEVKEDVPLAGIQKPPEVRVVKPINWTAEDVSHWLKGLKRGAFREYASRLPGDINGRALVRMNKAAIAQICAGGNMNDGQIIFNELRNEIDRVDAKLRKQRKGLVEMNTRIKGGW